MEDVNAEESNRNLKRHQYLPAQFVCRAPTLRAVAMSDAGVRMLMECRREPRLLPLEPESQKCLPLRVPQPSALESVRALLTACAPSGSYQLSERLATYGIVASNWH
ncbi:hypothetical protein CEP52_004117 [Fusarium oligoseptatum]|uniref:Uncharacterized protein n=1 Tax=Fusarium oligoseptatum TaxID=2604345 RepID=A0A428U5H9_9HYPO|nr:hypothetical protein CEP52_004117 [Fusarium oligoseptatum]